jgi:hypothetical protein
MPNMLIVECAHLHPNEWIREPNESYEIEVGGSDPSSALRENIRQSLHDWVLLPRKGFKAVVSTSAHQRHKRQVKGFIVYADSICERASEVLSSSGTIVRSDECVQTAQGILRNLDAMLQEEDEPDFHHRPTQYAYDLARQIIGETYTHYVGAPPLSTIAPDGQGGIIAEWKSGRRIVRLIVSPNQTGKSYVYSRGASQSLVDYSASGLTLSQQLSSVFPN